MFRKLAIACLALFVLPAVADTVYVTEFANPSPVLYQAALTPSLANQTVAVGMSSAQSAAFGANTRLIRVHADVVCSVQIGGTNPTATTSSMRMIAGQTEYFIVKPGDKLAVIENM